MALPRSAPSSVRPIALYRVRQLARLSLFLFILGPSMLGRAFGSDLEAQRVWRLLDYIAVDYSGAVSDGRVSNETEYAEMVEFIAQVETRLGTLPENGRKADLLRGAQALRSAITNKAAPAEVAAQSSALASTLLVAYPVPLAPTTPPDVARASTLYVQLCATCHGATGDGHGPAASGLDPPPIAFNDKMRADQRSLFGLYQVITQGLEGTSMPAFDSLSSQDRWSLAFYVGALAYPTSDISDGESLWRDDSSLRQKYPNLAALVGTTPASLAADIGSDKADAFTAYLRRNPESLANRAAGTLTLTRERLDASLKAYAAGDQGAATDLALSAYLDGFEPVEPMLAARDPRLMTKIEQAMAELRAAIGQARPFAEVQAANQELTTLFGEAESALAPEKTSRASIFLGAFGVLLREGLEALLIVVAMIAFLRKTDRADVLGFVHGGWASALVAGVLSWFIATYLIGISGASRELTEGFGSLFAATILVTVGIWMHGKSNAEAWQRYIKEKLTHALSKRSRWFLFLLAFVVVYREVFETILFYAALWAQGEVLAMLSGAAAAAALLAVLAWLMLRYSTRLPITKFFSWSALLIAILAVVLAGKGAAGLQEAGTLGVMPLANVPRIPLLGLFPTTQTVLAQVLVLAILVTGFWLNRKMAAQEK